MVVRTPSLVYIYLSIVSRKHMNENKVFLLSLSLSLSLSTPSFLHCFFFLSISYLIIFSIIKFIPCSSPYTLKNKTLVHLPLSVGNHPRVVLHHIWCRLFSDICPNCKNERGQNSVILGSSSGICKQHHHDGK